MLRISSDLRIKSSRGLLAEAIQSGLDCFGLPPQEYLRTYSRGYTPYVLGRSQGQTNTYTTLINTYKHSAPHPQTLVEKKNRPIGAVFFSAMKITYIAKDQS